jgi:Rps23 Pro-64 3,4-dihydroxylase Tpa1-like proline 4-hydroxylase
VIPHLHIDRFLPLERMQLIKASLRERYAAARPFPHVVVDDFLDPRLLEQVLAEFPAPGQIAWQSFDNEREVKLASASEARFGPATRLLLYHLNSITFLDFLSEVTAIPDLLSDPCFDGGGLHQIVPGGKLGIHADFNKHPRYGLDRRLNLLIYLNREWREEYGGALELWDRDMTRCEARILPFFNRVVVFGTTDFTYHGHPDPLACPIGMTRKSLALYYFSVGRPADEVSATHSTLFRTRPQGEASQSFGSRLRHAARELLPPIVARQLQRLR